MLVSMSLCAHAAATDAPDSASVIVEMNIGIRPEDYRSMISN